MKNRHIPVSVPVALLSALLATTSFSTLAADNLRDAIYQGKFGYSLLWRLENVDQDPLPHNATAIPLRARINFQTADLNGFSLKTEFDYIFHLSVDTFNAGAGNTPNPPGYPVIADPGGEDLNQLFLQYKAGFGQFRLGRQRIIYDNARFVGNVGWRLNEQTYDSFSFSQNAGADFLFKYAYIDKVNRIFGNDVPAGEHDQNTHLLNLTYKFENAARLTTYYYYIDNKDVAKFSNVTWGARFSGKTSNDGPKLGYLFEYANQKENADNPVDYSAEYWRTDLSLAFNWATIYAGYESLGGDSTTPGLAFRTPLATLHAFNGWADKFLATPDAGLKDAFVGIKGKAGKWNWNVLYHNFSAQSGTADFGTEFDGSIKRKIKDNFGILLKAASFSSDNPAYGDTTKLWVQLTADY